MKKILITTLIIYSLFVMACPQKKQFVKVSAQIARQTENLVDRNIQSYEEGLYGKEKAREFSDILDKKVIPTARAYNNAVEKLVEQFGKNPPRSEIMKLLDLFKAFESSFRELLDIFNALSPAQNSVLDITIASIKEAIAIIRETFSTAEIYGRQNQWA